MLLGKSPIALPGGVVHAECDDESGGGGEDADDDDFGGFFDDARECPYGEALVAGHVLAVSRASNRSLIQLVTSGSEPLTTPS
jgi:hypothetical protein